MSPSVWDDLERDARLQSIVPSIPKMKERCQATNAHLRRNISKAIESDVRDFRGSSHLPCQAFDHYERKNRSCLAQHWSCGLAPNRAISCQKAVSAAGLHDIALTAPSPPLPRMRH